MNPEQYKSWVEKVTQLNNWVDEIHTARDELYKSVADELKKVFKEYNPHIHITSDGSIARVTFEEGQKPVITSDMELNYPFTIGYELDNWANWIVVLEFRLLED